MKRFLVLSAFLCLVAPALAEISVDSEGVDDAQPAYFYCSRWGANSLVPGGGYPAYIYVDCVKMHWGDTRCHLGAEAEVFGHKLKSRWVSMQSHKDYCPRP